MIPVCADVTFSLLMIPRIYRVHWSWHGSALNFPSSLSQVFFQKFLELLFRNRPNLLALDHTILEKDQRGDAANTVLGRDFGITVYIDLGDLQTILKFTCHFLENGCDHFAGTTPLRPEVEQHGLRGLQDLRIKTVITDMRYAHDHVFLAANWNHQPVSTPNGTSGGQKPETYADLMKLAAQ